MGLRVTVLIENTAPPSLTAEHGLSFYLEYEGRPVLLDAGCSGRFAENAGRLGVDLAGVETAVLSHGHDDHANGFSAFFARNSKARLFARPAALRPWYMKNAQGEDFFVGIDPGLIAQHRSRFDLADGPRQILPGLHLIPDRVEHEQSLVAETPEGLVIFNSCCHAGAGYIVRDIAACFPGVPIRALLGGFHLVGAGGRNSLGAAPGIVRNLARWLTDELGVGEIYTGHCTGIPAYALLAEEIPERIHPLTTGLTLQF